MALNNISDVFAGATISGGNIVIPTGTLPGFSTGNDVSEGAQLVYGLLNALNKKVVESNLNNISTGSTLVFNNGVFVKSYNFGVNLSVGDNTVEGLDVVLEPNAVVIPTLAIAVDDTPLTEASGDLVDGLVLSAVTFTGDGVALGDVSSDYTFTITATDGGSNAAKMAVVYDSGWKLKATAGSWADDSNAAKAYKVAVTTTDSNDVDPQPVVEATFSITVTA